jgi:MFS family permease
MSKRYTTPLIFGFCLIGALYYFFETILEVAPSTMVDPMMNSFHIGGAKAGFIDVAYFVTYAIMQIPGGMLLDRYGARRIMPIAGFMVAFGLGLFALSHHYGFALFARILAGFGGAFGIMGALFIVSSWCKPRFLAFAIGITITIGLSGGLLQGLVSFLVETLSWRGTVCIFSIVACGFIAAFVLLYRDNPNRAHTYQTPWLDAWQVITNWRYWPIAVFGGLIYAPTATIGSMWGGNFLQAYFPSITHTTASEINGLIFLGWIVGSPLSGLISDLVKNRKWLLVICSAMVLICLLIITFDVHLSLYWMSLLYFLVGLFSSLSALTFAMGCEIKPKVRGTAIGFVNMLAILPALVTTPLFGHILDKHWTGHFGLAIKTFDLHAYQCAMATLYILVAAALLIALFLIRDTYSKES